PQTVKLCVPSACRCSSPGSACAEGCPAKDVCTWRVEPGRSTLSVLPLFCETQRAAGRPLVEAVKTITVSADSELRNRANAHNSSATCRVHYRVGIRFRSEEHTSELQSR